MKKGKRSRKKISNSKYWQTLYWHNYVETAILLNNVKYTTVNSKSVMTKYSKYTQHPLNCRRKMALYNIIFQEG